MNAWSGYGSFVNDEESNEISGNGLISGYMFKVWVDLRNNYIAILLGNNNAITISKLLKIQAF